VSVPDVSIDMPDFIYLEELSPIQMISSVEFKYKNIIDFVAGPKLTSQAEKQHQHCHEKVPSVDLKFVSTLRVFRKYGPHTCSKKLV
jgi:hypothetical protein